MTQIYLNSLGIINSLGNDKATIAKSVIYNNSGLITPTQLISGKQTYIGTINDSVLPSIPSKLAKYNCRNNQILLHACLQIISDIDKAIKTYGRDRVGIVKTVELI